MPSAPGRPRPGLASYATAGDSSQALGLTISPSLLPMLLRGIGLALLGQVGYDGKPGRRWIVWSGWVPGGIDDGGTGKLTLSAALSDPLLNLPEDVGHVEGQMVRRCRHHRTAGGERPEDPSVESAGVSWLAYTADRLGTFEAGPEHVPLVSCSESFPLNAVCGSPLFSSCRDRDVHRPVPDWRSGHLRTCSRRLSARGSARGLTRGPFRLLQPPPGGRSDTFTRCRPPAPPTKGYVAADQDRQGEASDHVQLARPVA